MVVKVLLYIMLYMEKLYYLELLIIRLNFIRRSINLIQDLLRLIYTERNMMKVNALSSHQRIKGIGLSLRKKNSSLVPMLLLVTSDVYTKVLERLMIKHFSIALLPLRVKMTFTRIKLYLIIYLKKIL